MAKTSGYGEATARDNEPRNRESRIETRESEIHTSQSAIRIALLTGGGDKPYALGMAAALTSKGILVDFIGSDYLDVPEVTENPRVKFFNLRGDQTPSASAVAKILRVAKYYLNLVRYSAIAAPRIFHILWNNKFELFDRTLLMFYYRLLGKKLLLTVHNVNAGKRDLNDSFLNRFSLRIQYKMCHHIFVHGDKLKREIVSDFRIPEEKVSVIPFGINNTVPDTSLSTAEAKRRLEVSENDKTLLFFGNVAPYKGLEYLVNAFAELLKRDRSYRLIIAGRIRGEKNYWEAIQRTIASNAIGDRIIERIEYIPDEETELYFKAADVLILPYTRVFQSGVLFLGYNFGLPAIAAEVGTLSEEIIEGETGFVFRPQNSSDLALKIEAYFGGALFHDLKNRRGWIKRYASERYSWDKVAQITTAAYADLLAKH